MLLPLLSIVAGFVLLMISAEYTVRGAVAIANKLRIPTIIIGLTIVAFGTSVPEFVVSVSAAVQGAAGISVGNVVGSNIANILLILGVSAMIYPLSCPRRVFIRDYLFLFAVTVLFTLFALGGVLVRWQGIVMLALLAAFLIYNYRNSKKSDVSGEALSPLRNSSWGVVTAITAAGLAGIIYGSDLLVDGAVALARQLGVSEETIGLTIVAFGTSLPELATSGMAAFRRQNGVALGNVIGSNIWNIVFIMGATSAITDVSVAAQFIHYDLWVMIGAMLLLFVMMSTKNVLSRGEGLIFTAGYLCYLLSQILISKGIWTIGGY